MCALYSLLHFGNFCLMFVQVVITYVSYLCARLLNLRAETQAARKIQLAWRKYRFQKNKRMFQVFAVFDSLYLF